MKRIFGVACSLIGVFVGFTAFFALAVAVAALAYQTVVVRNAPPPVLWRFIFLSLIVMSGAAGLIVLGRRLAPPRETVERMELSEYDAFCCWNCEGAELLALPARPAHPTFAACPTCKLRYAISQQFWEHLAPAGPDTVPYVIDAAWDQTDFAGRPLRGVAVFVASLGTALLGLVAAVWLVFWDWPTWVAAIPAGSLMILGLLVPSILFPLRITTGSTCSRCGYDLRGCVELRCPECGTPFGRRIKYPEKDDGADS